MRFATVLVLLASILVGCGGARDSLPKREITEYLRIADGLAQPRPTDRTCESELAGDFRRLTDACRGVVDFLGGLTAAAESCARVQRTACARHLRSAARGVRRNVSSTDAYLRARSVAFEGPCGRAVRGAPAEVAAQERVASTAIAYADAIETDDPDRTISASRGFVDASSELSRLVEHQRPITTRMRACRR